MHDTEKKEREFHVKVKWSQCNEATVIGEAKVETEISFSFRYRPNSF